MSWRIVVITDCAKLDYKLDYLVVRKVDQVTRVHLSEIRLLLVESTAVSMTSRLLCELVKKKIKVIFCDEKHDPLSELTPYYGSHDASAKLKRQIGWDSETRQWVWTEIVREKIRRQALHLKARECGAAAALLRGYLHEIEDGDRSNREGHAAKVYFGALFGLDFSRSQECSVNAALNYGYSLLLSAFNREIAANGYVTQLGLFHDNMFNPFNLSCDLMEPFRVLVDRAVYDMELKKFEHEEKMELLAVLNREVVIDGKRNSVANAVKIYCRSVFDALNEQDISRLKFYRDELSIYADHGVF